MWPISERYQPGVLDAPSLEWVACMSPMDVLFRGTLGWEGTESKFGAHGPRIQDWLRVLAGFA